jgi:hypothetical protein
MGAGVDVSVSAESYCDKQGDVPYCWSVVVSQQTGLFVIRSKRVTAILDRVLDQPGGYRVSVVVG